MSDSVYKKIEVVGTSSQSFSDAVHNAVSRPVRRSATRHGLKSSNNGDGSAKARLTNTR